MGKTNISIHLTVSLTFLLEALYVTIYYITLQKSIFTAIQKRIYIRNPTNQTIRVPEPHHDFPEGQANLY